MEHTANVASAALPRMDPDGDYWWVYARPSGASDADVLNAYLRITGNGSDTTSIPSFLRLEIDTDSVTLVDSVNDQLVTAPISTSDDTDYLIHAYVVGTTAMIRRGEVGQPMETVLATDNAPLQDTDRFILETTNACQVYDVNIGRAVTTYALSTVAAIIGY